MPKPSFSGVTAGRRRNMQANKNKNTQPELLVRRFLHAAGFRYRLHRRDLPGKPDIVLPRYRTVIEVRGCFWHGHGCKLGKMPKARQEYWGAKINATKERDQANRNALETAGWRLLELWECDLRNDPDCILKGLQAALRGI